MESRFAPKQNRLPLCPSPIGGASWIEAHSIGMGVTLLERDFRTLWKTVPKIYGTGNARSPSRPAALLGTVALGVRNRNTRL